MKRIAAVSALIGILNLTPAWGADKPAKVDPAKTKETYIKNADAEVEAWSTKLKLLEERSEKSGEKTRKEIDRSLKTLKETLEEARQKLDTLRGSNEGTWKKFRKGLEETLNDVKRGYRKTTSYFDKKEKS